MITKTPTINVCLIYFKNSLSLSLSKTYLTNFESFFILIITGNTAPKNPIISDDTVITASSASLIFLL